VDSERDRNTASDDTVRVRGDNGDLRERVELRRSVEWYGKVLGFELVYRLDQYGWGEMRTPLTGITIGLGQSEELKHGGTVPTFTVRTSTQPARTSSRWTRASTAKRTRSRAW
jgi:catechol 2,3-dioxygenase-like lactoylglutathione lyase family enzyme